MLVARMFSLSLLALLPSAAWAGHAGSMEDQVACTPDVYRLCAQQIPDEDAITACLKEHLTTLSPACHKVFSPSPASSSNNNNDDND